MILSATPLFHSLNSQNDTICRAKWLLRRRRRNAFATLVLRELESRTVPSTNIPLNNTSWTAMGPATIAFGTNPYAGRTAGIAADPTDANIVYIAAAGGGVWKTTNATAANPSWTPLTDTQASLFMGAIAIAPSNPSVIYAGTGEATNSLLSYYGRGVLKSIDAGATWTLVGSSQFDRRAISRIVVDPTDANIVYVAVGGGGVNGASGNTGIWKSTNGGTTWTNTTASISTSQPYSDVGIDLNTPSTLYCAIGNTGGNAANGVYKTTNGGTSWSLMGGGITSGSTTGRINLAVSKSNPLTVYVSMEDSSDGSVLSVWQTTDGGANWTDRTPPSNLNYMGGQGWYDQTIIVDPTNSSTVYVGGSAGTNAILKSSNGGVSWSGVGSGGKSPHADQQSVAFDANGKLLEGTDGGIWRLDNPTVGSTSWSNLNGSGANSLNITQFIGIAIHPTNADIAYGGSQDNGTEKFSDAYPWSFVEGGDGGEVIVDSNTPATVYHIAPVASFGSADFIRKSTNSGGKLVVNHVGDCRSQQCQFLSVVCDGPEQLQSAHGGDRLRQRYDQRRRKLGKARYV